MYKASASLQEPATYQTLQLRVPHASLPQVRVATRLFWLEVVGWVLPKQFSDLCVCCTGTILVHGAHFRRLWTNHFCVLIHHNIILFLESLREAIEF